MSTTIENVRVFDGDGLTAPRSVHLEGARIVAAAAPGAEVVDGRGGALLPGLIDTHVHVESRVDLEKCAEWGVTTALDMGSAVALRQAVGHRLGPAAGLLHWPRFDTRLMATAMMIVPKP